MIEKLRDYLRPFIEERSANPGEDVISEIVTSKLDGRFLTDDEKMQLLVTILLGGLETVSSTRGTAQTLRASISSGLEGVAEVWLDSMDVAGALATDRYYLDNVVPDNKNFVDAESLQLFCGEEEVVQPFYDGAAGSRYDREWRVENCCFCIKLMVLVRDCARASWHRSSDTELGQRLNAYRHVRCHPIAPEQFVGVRELYWPSLSSFENGVAADAAALVQICHSSDDALSLLLRAERLI